MQFLIESEGPFLEDYIHDFCAHVCTQLGITEHPELTLVDKTGSTSFGSYRPGDGSIIVATEGRHVADVLRTLAHEIVHDAQHLNGSPDMPLDELEYEANAMAGMLMRDWNKLHPEVYGADEGSDHASEQEYESQGAVGADTTRPTGPIAMAEEGIVNSAGAGNVAGIGIGPQGEPGVLPKKRKGSIMKPMVRRKTLSGLKEELMYSLKSHIEESMKNPVFRGVHRGHGIYHHGKYGYGDETQTPHNSIHSIHQYKQHLDDHMAKEHEARPAHEKYWDTVPHKDRQHWRNMTQHVDASASELAYAHHQAVNR